MMNGARDDAFRSMYLSGGPGGPFSDKVGRARGTTDEGHIYTMQMLIENTNFEYITAEDGPLKIELRDKLQDLVESWVCSTPVSRKYYWYTIHMLVTRSLRSPQNAENPARKVGDAFLALAKYAGNIFSNPWRPEFRQIKLYGGYWFHEVGAVLDNPNWILSKLGYASTRESEHIWELSPDISVETLGEIHWASLDCFVAAVECQMISRIFSSVVSQEPSVTLEDVIQYREAHVGTWEYAVQGILYQARAHRFAPAAYPPPAVLQPPPPAPQWQLPQDYQQGPYCPQPPPPPAPSREDYYAQHPHHHQAPYYAPHYQQPALQPQQHMMQYPHPQHPYQYPQQQQLPTPPPPPPPQQQHYAQPYYDHFDPYHPQVPINQFGQMNIKLAKQNLLQDQDMLRKDSKHHQMRSESSSSRKHSRTNSMDAAIVPERPKARLEKKKSTPSSQQHQDEHSWEYVYSDLSSKGYNKDLGLRPDVLSESKKGSVRDKEEPRSRESPRRVVKEEVAPPPPPAPKGPTEWKCNACTFLNRPDSNICSICYKSKDVVTEVQAHIHQGPECPQCTFKNFASRDYCDACGALLRPPLPVEDMV